MQHTRDLAACLRPAFYVRGGARRRFSLERAAPCCGGRACLAFLATVCGWVALPLAVDFAARNNGWLAAHDAGSLLRSAQAAVPALELRVVDGNASWAGEDPAAGRDGPPLRAEFPRSYYELFEDPPAHADVVATYFFEVAMAHTLRYLDPSWGDDANNFRVATPVEFIAGETVEAKPAGSSEWRKARVATVEPSTKLNRYNYTLLWADGEGAGLPEPGGGADADADADDAPAAEPPADSCDAATTAELAERIGVLVRPGLAFGGFYRCSQGRTRFSLRLSSVEGAAAEGDGEDAATVAASFHFSQGAENCSGQFRLHGALRPDGHLNLQPDELGSHTAGWVDNSCNYSSIGLVGKVDPEAGAFAGQVNDTGGACSTFAAFVEPAPETFEVEVLGDWWGEANVGAGCSLQVSVDGVRLELKDADVAQERNASQGVTLDQLASALSTMDDGDVDEDDVLSILIKLILAESEALEFPLSGESGRVAWEVLESSDSIHLKFKVRDND